jgi:hypothetical protein
MAIANGHPVYLLVIQKNRSKGDRQRESDELSSS